jgi:hypothetical protein
MSWDTLTEPLVTLGLRGRAGGRMRAGPGVVLMLVLATGCPITPPPPPAATVAGVYTARTAAADASARIVTLWLQPGGAVILETVYVGKQRTPSQGGRWSANGDEVTVTLDGQAQPLVFTIAGDRLVPKQWDRTQYGNDGLTLSRRASYQREGPTLRDAFSAGANKPAP